MEALDGPPGGGAEVDHPDDTHLGRWDPGQHRILPQPQLRDPAGEDDGPPPRAAVPDPRGHPVHLLHAHHAPQPRLLRPRLRPRRPPVHAAAVGHHVPPAHRHRHGHRIIGQRGRRARGGEAEGGGRRPRAGGSAESGGAHQRFLVGAAVRHPRASRGVHVGGSNGVPLRPGAGEHEKHGGGAVLARHVDRELHGHRLSDRGAPLHQQGRRLAARQHQQGEVRLLLLAGDGVTGAQLGLLHNLCNVVHLQATGNYGRSGG